MLHIPSSYSYCSRPLHFTGEVYLQTGAPGACSHQAEQHLRMQRTGNLWSCFLSQQQMIYSWVRNEVAWSVGIWWRNKRHRNTHIHSPLLIFREDSVSFIQLLSSISWLKHWDAISKVVVMLKWQKKPTDPTIKLKKSCPRGGLLLSHKFVQEKKKRWI